MGAGFLFPFLECAGEMKPERVALFEKLLEMGKRYRRVNQWD